MQFAADPSRSSEEVARLLRDPSAQIRRIAATQLRATTDSLDLALKEHPELIKQVAMHDNAPLRVVADLLYVETSPRAQERFVAAVGGNSSELAEFRQFVRSLPQSERDQVSMSGAWAAFSTKNA